ncbi:MAG: hypothetical protein ACREMY_21460, partial [bacterium]
MLRVALAILAIGAATTVTMSSVVAQPQDGQLLCIPYRGCVNAPQQRYNDCFQLALRRGWNTSKTDYRGLNSFIFRCLEG